MPISSRRVVITGMGVISPLGNSPDALWTALQAGRSAVRPLANVPTTYSPTSFGAEAIEFTGDIEEFGPLDKEQKKAIRKGLKLMSRESQMGVAAAQLALSDSGLAGKLDPDRTGVVFGSDYMVTRPEDFISGVSHCLNANGKFEFERWAQEGMPQVTPLWLLKYLPNMPASHVAIYNDLRGPNNSITTREASSNQAVGEAFRTITRGSSDVMLAGATGTRVHPTKLIHVLLQEEVASNGREPAQASRPFDRGRNGMVLGEGAASIVLETLEFATARRAKIAAEVVGYASSQAADRNLVAKRDVALANVIRGALRDAGMKPTDIGHIHAHGLSTRSCDIDEARAIREVFGPLTSITPVVAAKSYFGNLGAGGGLVELIASVLCIQLKRLFATLNYDDPDSQCPVHVVTDAAANPGTSCLNLNVTPQGQASAVIVKAFMG